MILKIVTSHLQLVAMAKSFPLRWPGFVEFDDVNGKVLTYSAQDNTYKVWSMLEPAEALYAFSERTIPEGIQEIKISHNALHGAIPSGWGKLDACTALRASHNNIEEPIAALRGMQALEMVDLGPGDFQIQHLLWE